MRSQYTKNTLTVVVLAGLLVAAQAVATAPRAQAQCDVASPTCNLVSADVKGRSPGGFSGRRIGFMIPAIIIGAGAHELDEVWAWIVFPVAFAAIGAVVGYFTLEDPQTGVNSAGQPVRGFPEVSVALLAISMALVIPTFVGVLALTSYGPEPEPGASGATGDEDADDDGGTPANDSADETQGRHRSCDGGRTGRDPIRERPAPPRRPDAPLRRHLHRRRARPYAAPPIGGSPHPHRLRHVLADRSAGLSSLGTRGRGSSAARAIAASKRACGSSRAP